MRPNSVPLRLFAFCFAFQILSASRSPVSAIDLEGFTEPIRLLKVATDETGTIVERFVEEGQQVKAGQPLVKLNSDVHEAMLAIAAQNMKAEGRILSTQADLELRMTRLAKISEIQNQGFARQEEVDRATAEVEIAEANLRAAREDAITKELEHRKILVQLQRRTVTSPIAGTVTQKHKDQGEFVAPNSPDILTLAQLEVLLANFTLTGKQAETLHRGDRFPVIFVDGEDAEGVVEFVSPTMDAESGTILVKFRIDNPNGRYRSGQRCRIRLPD